MTTYKIIHYTNESQLGIDVYKTNVFRQTELQAQFESLVKKLKPGESAEYMKEDAKQFYPSMLYVENQNGILYSYTPKGHKRYSMYNDLLTATKKTA
jgi:hypothetical protein